MLLFQKRFHEGLVSGAISLTFRRWQKPHVKPGGRYRCHPIGVLEVDAIERLVAADVSSDDARRAGFATRRELFDYMDERSDEPIRDDTEMYRVALHYGGDGDRVSLALDSALSKEDIAALRLRLARFDANEAWTKKTLRLIERHPRVAASKLAAKVGAERDDFKANVRKLKRLGLTQSFEVGYEISPRGRAFLDATRRKR